MRSCGGPSALLFQEREPRTEGAQALLGRVDPLAESLVVGLERHDALPRLFELGSGQHSAVCLRLLQLGFGAQGAPTPRRALLADVTKYPLELLDGFHIGPLA